MSHLPIDPRLLTNLIADEKEYHKHLIVLLDTYAKHSLLSLSAYAAASPAPVARAVIAVAGSLAGADYALRQFATSIEAWQTEMQVLKSLEEEMAGAIRDREIIVTRLLDRSQSQRSRKGSVVGTLNSSVSGTKADEAQAELRTSERVLAAKRRRLDDARTDIVRRGLERRCKAMEECGQTWTEMGKAGLRVLEGISPEDDSDHDDSFEAGRFPDMLVDLQDSSTRALKQTSSDETRVRSSSPTQVSVPSRAPTQASAAQPQQLAPPNDSLLFQPTPQRAVPGTAVLPPSPRTPQSPSPMIVVQNRPHSPQIITVVPPRYHSPPKVVQPRPRSPPRVTIVEPPRFHSPPSVIRPQTHSPQAVVIQRPLSPPRSPSPQAVIIQQPPSPPTPPQPFLIIQQPPSPFMHPPQQPVIIQRSQSPYINPPQYIIQQPSAPFIPPHPTIIQIPSEASSRTPSPPTRRHFPLSDIDEVPEMNFQRAVRTKRRQRAGPATPVMPSPGWYPGPPTQQPFFVPPPPTIQVVHTDRSDDSDDDSPRLPSKKISSHSRRRVRAKNPRPLITPTGPFIVPPPPSTGSSERERRVRTFFRSLTGIFKGGDKHIPLQTIPENYYYNEGPPIMPGTPPSVVADYAFTSEQYEAWSDDGGRSNTSRGPTVVSTSFSQPYTSYTAFTSNTQQSNTSHTNYYMGGRRSSTRPSTRAPSTIMVSEPRQPHPIIVRNRSRSPYRPGTPEVVTAFRSRTPSPRRARSRSPRYRSPVRRSRSRSPRRARSRSPRSARRFRSRTPSHRSPRYHRSNSAMIIHASSRSPVTVIRARSTRSSSRSRSRSPRIIRIEAALPVPSENLAPTSRIVEVPGSPQPVIHPRRSRSRSPSIPHTIVHEQHPVGAEDEPGSPRSLSSEESYGVVLQPGDQDSPDADVSSLSSYATGVEQDNGVD